MQWRQGVHEPLESIARVDKQEWTNQYQNLRVDFVIGVLSVVYFFHFLFHGWRERLLECLSLCTAGCTTSFFISSQPHRLFCLPTHHTGAYLTDSHHPCSSGGTARCCPPYARPTIGLMTLTCFPFLRKVSKCCPTSRATACPTRCHLAHTHVSPLVTTTRSSSL
jgi:hypothetical protein